MSAGHGADQPADPSDQAVVAALAREMAELKRLIAKYATDDIRGELWLRQAELYREKARLVNVPNLNLRAVKLGQKFLREFPASARVPEVMALIGYNYFEAGKSAAGEKTLLELTDKFSRTEHAATARLRLAEFYFDQRRW
jgi:hypothetical protein